MMKLGLIASLCMNTNEKGPHYFRSLLEKTAISQLDFELVEEAIKAEMLMDLDFIDWFTQKLTEWNVSLHPEVWNKHQVYYAPNAQSLLQKIYTDYKATPGDVRTSWNEFIFLVGKKPQSKKYLPNDIQIHIQMNKEVRKNKLPLYGPFPFLAAYLTWYAEKNGMTIKLLITELSYFIENGYDLIQILQFFTSWTTTDLEFMLFRDRVLQGLDPIYLQLFFSQEQCWWDSSDDGCDQCQETNWLHFLPQYRCGAICVTKGGEQCKRFAQPLFDFCLFHQKKKPVLLKKRLCKDNCPSSDKKAAYENNPFDFTPRVVLYPKTTRAVSDLPQYNPRQDWIENEWYLPCVRYDRLYYSGHDAAQDATFCGKFFYYEPDASTVIRLGKSLFCASKVQAWLRLQFLTKGAQPWHPPDKQNWLPHDFFLKKVCPLLKHSQFLQSGKYDCRVFERFIMYKILNTLKNECGLGNWDSYLDPWLTFHFCTLFTSLEDTFDCVDDIGIPLFFPSIQPNDPLSENFFAQFDIFDQEICTMARILQLDTVVFQHEIGHHDCVTEIMSVHPDFHHHLFRVENPITTKIQGQRILPKVWFPRDDGLFTVIAGEIQHQSLLKPELIFWKYESFQPRKKFGQGFMRDAESEFSISFPKRRQLLWHF